MPLIEGLGDEVTLIMGTILLCVVLTLAWFSTHTADLPALREVGITVIERTQIRRRVTIHRPDNTATTSNDIVGQVNVDNNEDDSRSSNQDADTASPVETIDAPTIDSNTPADVQQDSALPGSSSLIKDTSESSCDNEKDKSERSTSKDTQTEVSASTKDTTLVDKTIGDEDKTIHPQQLPSAVEEEVRRRRVQYFQNSQPGSSAGDNINQQTSDESYCTYGQNISISDTKEAKEAPLEPPIDTSCRLGASSHPSEEKSDAPPESTTAQDNVSPSAHTQANQPDTSRGSNSSSAPNQQSNPSAPTRIRVKLKYMNETQRLVHASPTDTIGDFRRAHFQEELADQNKWVRFIYNGQDLRDDGATLQAYQVGDNCTMHCLITNKIRSPPGGGPGRGASGRIGDDDDEDSVMGALMYPLFTLVLLVVWYFRLTYRQYFNPMSTVCLIGISFLLGLGYFSSLRNQRQQARAAAGQGEAQAGHVHSD